MDKSTLSRDVESLLKRGWLRKVAGGDRRSHKLELTPAGRDKVAAILPAWQAAQTALRAKLGTENLAGVFAAADRVWAEE